MKEIQDLLKLVDGPNRVKWTDDDFNQLFYTPEWKAFATIAKNGSFWPTPIAFADEKPKEGQRIFYWARGKQIIGWYDITWTKSTEFTDAVTHWIPAPPDLPEPKQAWEVAWEDCTPTPNTGWRVLTKPDFKAIWDRAQKERV